MWWLGKLKTSRLTSLFVLWLWKAHLDCFPNLKVWIETRKLFLSLPSATLTTATSFIKKHLLQPSPILNNFLDKAQICLCSRVCMQVSLPRIGSSWRNTTVTILVRCVFFVLIFHSKDTFQSEMGSNSSYFNLSCVLFPNSHVWKHAASFPTKPVLTLSTGWMLLRRGRCQKLLYFTRWTPSSYGRCVRIGH